MFCSNCGSRLEEDAAYCHSCGAPAKGNIPENQHIETVIQNQTQKPIESGRDLNNGTVYVALGWVFFGLSFLIIPILFGAGAFIMGFLTYRVRSQTHGVILMVMAVVGTVLGIIIGIIVASASYFL